MHSLPGFDRTACKEVRREGKIQSLCKKNDCLLQYQAFILIQLLLF